MKRCPQCHRIETDEALKFCRVDGATLISDSGSISGDAGTAKFGSGAVSSEIETSILPHPTDAGVNRPTAPTTVLPASAILSTTGELANPKRRGVAIGVAGVALVAIIVIGYFYLVRNRTAAIDSIAVLPFQNTSGDPDAEYLSDGIAESLINSLTQLKQLKVVARATAFRFKSKDIDPQQVGRQLNVRTVLMGRVRQTGDNLDIQVDLVDAQTGAQLWGEQYQRKVSEIVDVKQAIAREVTEKLRLRLSGDQQQELAKHDTKSAEAYQSYLRGRYFWNKRTREDTTKAMSEFQRTIEYDPGFALGYVGLADCYIIQEEYAGVPASDSLPKARALADRALEIDDSSAEAHTSSAMTYQHLWKWAEAEAEYKRAISLNPNYPTVHQWYSNYLFATGRLDESLAEGKRAQQLDPLAPIIGHTVTYVYLQKNDLNSAIEESKKTLGLAPDFPPALTDLGWAYVKQRRYEEAAAEFKKAVDSSGRGSGPLGNLGYCYAVMGKRTEALAIIQELETRYTNGEVVTVFLAGVYAGLGDKDHAFALLEKDFQRHTGQIPTITFWLSLESLRTDPRYADLVRRMGLKP